MYRLIGPDNTVAYGRIHEESIDFNCDEFILRDFFDREIRGFRRAWKFHKFNYIALTAGKFFAGIGIVDLGYLCTIFCYLYDLSKGKLFEYETKSPFRKVITFPTQPDSYRITYKNMAVVEKSSSFLSVTADFGSTLKLDCVFPCERALQKPLRLASPASHNGWTFTEKMVLHAPTRLEIMYKGAPLPVQRDDAFLLSDWTAGFLRRETCWTWAAFSGHSTDGKPAGANLSAFVNETYYSENTYWLAGIPMETNHVIFEFRKNSPSNPWHIYSRTGDIDLLFTPMQERTQKLNLVALKSYFRQFLGVFEGTLGNQVSISEISGVTEIHRALW